VLTNPKTALSRQEPAECRAAFDQLTQATNPWPEDS